MSQTAESRPVGEPECLDTKKIDVRFHASSMTPFDSDMCLGNLLAALISYRRADEARGHRFTGSDGQILPTLPVSVETIHAA